MKVYIILKECHDSTINVDKAFASYENAEKYIIGKYWSNSDPNDPKIKAYAKINIEVTELEQ